MIKNRIESIVSAIAGVCIGLGGLVLLTAAHDNVVRTEDTRVVWVCRVQGNQTCGIDTPPVIIEPTNLLNW